MLRVTLMLAGFYVGSGERTGEKEETTIAATDLSLAILTREAMQLIISEQPGVAARLLLAMAKLVADHLRETNRKLMTFAQVSKALQQELDAAHSVNRRLLSQEGYTIRGAQKALRQPGDSSPPVPQIPPAPPLPTAIPSPEVERPVEPVPSGLDYERLVGLRDRLVAALAE